MNASRRLGLYGGSFDPPHNAHVALAQAAVAQLKLDELRVLPTGDAWHKSRQLTPAHHRLAMARAAFALVPGAVVDDREVRRGGATYTIDTLRELQAEHSGCEFFLVLGQDQAIALAQWRDWQEIVRIATLAVAGRPDAERQATLAAAGLPRQARVIRLQLPGMAESSSGVRERLARGEDISSLVPPGVASYIASHHPYQGH